MNPAVELMDESVIREMTRVSEDCGAINLAQGFPEYPVPEQVLRAAVDALRGGDNRYTRTWGSPLLRKALARYLSETWGLEYDPEEELVITCGASEAIMATLLALLAPGDPVVIVEPIYENYLPAVRLAGAVPRVVSLDPFSYGWDKEEFSSALGGAKVMLLNTPSNPAGKVWSRSELETLCEMVAGEDALLVTDETYWHITYGDHRHVPPAAMGGMRDRTVTISSFSKTYAVTGWRVGFAAAPSRLMSRIRRVHDFMTVCAPAPFQTALCKALSLPDSYYESVRSEYEARKTILRDGLRAKGWRTNDPQGSYFLLLDVSPLGIEDDREWAAWFARRYGVAGVPSSAFMWAGLPREDGAPDRRGMFLRLSFAKSREELVEAVHRFPEFEELFEELA